MHVQRVLGNNFNTSFKSRVYITNYDTQEANLWYAKDLFNSKNFLNSIKALENNGNNDTVVFGVNKLGFVHMTVRDGDRISTAKVYIKNPYDSDAYNDKKYKFKSVSDAYEECKVDAIENSWDAEIPARIDKYVIC